MDLEAHEIHRYDKALARYETEQALPTDDGKMMLTEIDLRIVNRH